MPRLSFQAAVVSPSNQIYILDALPAEEASAGRRTHVDVLDGVLAQDLDGFAETRRQVHLIECGTAIAFRRALSRIEADCHAGARPLLFIHGHGDKNAGLQLASGEWIGWTAYREALAAVTQTAGGELTVIAAFCQSMTIVSRLPTGGRLPFAFYYGYDGSVSTGAIQDETAALYGAFLRDGGRTVPKTLPRLRSHSEYDHVAEVLTQLCTLWLPPDTVAPGSPRLSKRSLWRRVEEQLRAEGQRLHRVGTVVNTALYDDALLDSVVGTYMHNTDRRRCVIDAMRHWRDSAKAA
jgi:hypothetical protein